MHINDAITNYLQSKRASEVAFKRALEAHQQRLQLHGPYQDTNGGLTAVCLSCETTWPCRVFNDLANSIEIKV